MILYPTAVTSTMCLTLTTLYNNYYKGFKESFLYDNPGGFGLY